MTLFTKVISNWLTSALTFLLPCLLAIPGSASADPVRISTSTTAFPLIARWTDAYTAAHPETQFSLSNSPSSEASISALNSRAADLTVLPRRLRRKETESSTAALGGRPTEARLAIFAVPVYVNTNNAIKAVDMDSLESILKGETKTWKDLGGKEAPISVYVPSDAPAVLEYLRDEFFLGKPLPQACRPLPLSDLCKLVSENPETIGFGTSITPTSIRLLPIKRAQSSPPEIPTRQSITEMDYPLARYSYAIAAPTTLESIKSLQNFLDWIRSDDGQNLLQGTAFYPLGPKQRFSPAK